MCHGMKNDKFPLPISLPNNERMLSRRLHPSELLRDTQGRHKGPQISTDIMS